VANLARPSDVAHSLTNSPMKGTAIWALILQTRRIGPSGLATSGAGFFPNRAHRYGLYPWQPPCDLNPGASVPRF